MYSNYWGSIVTTDEERSGKLKRADVAVAQTAANDLHWSPDHALSLHHSSISFSQSSHYIL